MKDCTGEDLASVFYETVRAICFDPAESEWSEKEEDKDADEGRKVLSDWFFAKPNVRAVPHFHDPKPHSSHPPLTAACRLLSRAFHKQIDPLC